jgi:hypothetical protein
VPLGPAQVHPPEHLGPIRRLRTARTGTDREECAAIVVLAGEQQRRPFPLEVTLQRTCLALELGGQLGIIGLLDELEGRQEIIGAALEVAPQRDIGSKRIRLAEDLLRASLVVPEAGRAG